MYQIMLVEDDLTISGILARHLGSWGYRICMVQDFEHVLDEFIRQKPQLVLLDLKLPCYNGFHWCDEIRRISQVPVLFLSSASDNMNMVMAMSRGADDFIAKPFDLDVLTAKVQAILRRTYSFGPDASLIQCGRAVLNLSAGTVSSGDISVSLTKNEQKILELLFSQAGRAVSREAIMTKLWESDSFVDDNTLTVNMTRLRKKLSDIGLADLIVTKKGIGYMAESK